GSLDSIALPDFVLLPLSTQLLLPFPVSSLPCKLTLPNCTQIFESSGGCGTSKLPCSNTVPLGITGVISSTSGNRHNSLLSEKLLPSNVLAISSVSPVRSSAIYFSSNADFSLVHGSGLKPINLYSIG